MRLWGKHDRSPRGPKPEGHCTLCKCFALRGAGLKRGSEGKAGEPAVLEVLQARKPAASCRSAGLCARPRSPSAPSGAPASFQASSASTRVERVATAWSPAEPWAERAHLELLPLSRPTGCQQVCPQDLSARAPAAIPHAPQLTPLAIQSPSGPQAPPSAPGAHSLPAAEPAPVAGVGYSRTPLPQLGPPGARVGKELLPNACGRGVIGKRGGRPPPRL